MPDSAIFRPRQTCRSRQPAGFVALKIHLFTGLPAANPTARQKISPKEKIALSQGTPAAI
jgi:hypothetical protein